MLLEELILVTMSSVGAALGTWETKHTIVELYRIQPHTQDSLLLVRTSENKEERILGTSFCGIRLDNAIVIKGAELYKKRKQKSAELWFQKQHWFETNYLVKTVFMTNHIDSELNATIS